MTGRAYNAPQTP